MRKHVLLSLIMSLYAMSAWATDVSWTQDYEYIDKNGSVVSTEQTYHTSYADWVRYKACSRWNDSKKDFYYNTDGSTQLRGLYLTHDGVNQGFYKCVLPEGGIKSVSFKWRQRNVDDDNKRLRLRIYINDVEINAERIAVNGGSSKRTANQSYNSTSALCTKTAGEVSFKILNDATESKEDLTSVAGTVIISPITITQYLRYMQKSVTIGLPNKGYINRNLIDNTEDTENIRYSILDKNAETTLVADIDALTGAITPKAAGTAIVTASWEGVTTTYELTVDPNIYVESFSQNASYAESTSAEKSWDSDVSDIIPSWEAYLTMRTESDTIGGTYVHGTYLGTTSDAQGYLKTSGAVEGGVKELSFDWKQGRAGTGCTLTLAMYLGGETKVCEDSKTGTNASPGTDIWNYNYDGTISVQANSVLEIKNTSTVGSKNPRVILSAIKITPYLLYYDRDVEWDRTSDSGDSYKNEGWINHTSNDADITYGISDNEINAEVDDEGKVTSEGGGDVTITATWKSVTTSYNLHIKANTTASFAESIINKDVADAAFSYPVTKTVGSPNASYTSSNGNVATVASNGTVTINGVGQTKITATIIGNDDYSDAEASYILRVTDNSANALVETFSAVDKDNAANHAGKLWEGDVYQWRVSDCGGVRKYGDKFASDQDREGIWMGTPDPNTNYSSLTTESDVEGGIKHLWFYCEQPYNTGETDYTLKPVVYLNSAIESNKIRALEIEGTSGAANIAANRTLFGASNVMKSNSVLIIRNESFLTSDGSRPTLDPLRGRFLLDEIHITPWLLYARKSVSIAVDGGTFINEGLINTTAGESGTLSYSSSNPAVATVEKDGDGQCVVTPHAIGVTTIEAKFDWGGGNYVTTTYQLNVVSALVRVENYANATKQGQQIDPITYTGNYSQSWTYRKVRIKDDRVNSEQAIWMSRYWDGSSNDKNCYIETTSAEGGIKQVSFNWQQANNGDDGKILCLDIKVAGERVDGIEEEGSASLRSDYQTCTKNLQVKSNSKFTLHNNSHVKNSTNIANGRILVGPITITPYLFYLEREKTIMTGETYINPMIDNTDGEGTVSYSLISPSTAGAATINAKTGEVTTSTPGTVTVKALWSEGAYTTYTLHIVDVILEDEANNSATIEAKDGLTVGVLLKDRTIRTGGYNTLCLPFAVSEETLQTTLPGAKAYEFTNAYLSETNLDIRFDKVTELEAGKPYLVTVPKDVANPVFAGVTIDASSESEDINIIRGDNMRFIGSFNSGTMNNTGLYVVADKLYRVESAANKTIGACRAYFDVLPGAQAVPRNVRMRIVAGKETTTDVVTVSGDRLEVSGKFIENGQLIIIREGKKYNAQGIQIR